MPLAFAAIAPHGGIVLEELCEPPEAGLAAKTRAAMEELGRRFEAARVDAVIILTPHNAHVDRHISVITARQLAGEVEEDNGKRVSLHVPGDRPLALDVLRALQEVDASALGVSFGGNDPDFSDGQVMPMDWGTLIPLWFMGGRSEPARPCVVVVPSRDLSGRDHVSAGRAIGELAHRSERRLALIASADHGHAHDASGPYGFDPAAKEYDELVVRLIESDRLGELEFVDADLVERAKADSWWQLLMLYGAVNTRLELLSYEAPTYFGMLCAGEQLDRG